ncbi:M23 family metallopeptidase [Flavobacterium sp.]|uniref:M23 family metallopeptidase n=1 Tax=Flavobacterium sp. TaxID=239 RepID=UPI00352730AB
MKYFLLLVLSFTVSYSQSSYPDDFISPLEIPIDLSGNFGELRSNHFHSGLDIKTQKREGLNVLAVADGYVSRIKISTFGYGKAIYITHSNGYTTVYAHLQKANGAIEDYIKKKQYAAKSYEVEMFPAANELPVKQGDVIAFSGNSGGSGGPHLHFEFRDTKTENIVNPLHFGFTKFVKDVHKPAFQTLMVYPIDNAVVNKSEIPALVSFSKQADGNYLAATVKTNGKIGFGINVYDNCTNPYNKNGVYKITAHLNGVLYYESIFDTFAFAETRYINNFIDYATYKNKQQRFQKLFFETPYPLSVVTNAKNNGIINTQPNTNYTLKIEISDYQGNTTKLSIPIEYANEEAIVKAKPTETSYKLNAKVENNYSKDNVSVYIPENAFYDNFDLEFDVKDQILYLHNEMIPVQKHITITFSDVQNLTEAQMEKTFIASLDGVKLDYNSTKRKGNSFSARVRNLGTFKLAQDLVPPRIYNVNFIEGRNLMQQKILRVSVSDNLSGINTYNAYLNEEWILMEYDYKTNTLQHDLSDKKYKEGRNDFKVIVTDEMQNSTTFESYFFMNP